MPRPSASTDMIIVDHNAMKNDDTQLTSNTLRRLSTVSADSDFELIHFGDHDYIEPADVDSDDDNASTTSDNSHISLTPAFYNHHISPYGRRYHGFESARSYILPNDPAEHDREDLLHLLSTNLTWGRHFLAPIGDNLNKILDLGCGTGKWTVEVADKFPFAKVVGVDLSPIQPVMSPENVEWWVDDIEDEEENFFETEGKDYDFVHARFLMPMVVDAGMVVRRCFEHLKPGGWIETQDLHPQIKSDDNSIPAKEMYPPGQFFDLANIAWAQAGTDYRLTPQIGEMMLDAGFVNVTSRQFKVPLGGWPRDEYACFASLIFSHPPLTRLQADNMKQNKTDE
ncbi:S-adenosyl-L-methionine-dependent methyltransferase [Sordaria brevicollis]|uniref:S-adenosyl-L-methionine-dependent methyltransferase n=1 Tax=Sordaria brevicollis TaxID=83679 RepID=A0AAE0PM88_SORBR|nr:S-adenosyl-L-methionine-dependent methyltransferase [Sordaria brevicollis]